MSIESVMLSNHLILCCSQYFPASGSFPMSRLFTSGSQIIGASASVLPLNIQGWFPLGLSGLMSLQPKGLSRVFSCVVGRGCLLWPVHFLGKIIPKYSLEGLIWSGSSNTLASWCKERIHWKSPHAGKDRRQEEKGMTEDVMAGLHHQLNGHEFQQTQGDSEGQGSLVCCSSWDHKE